MAHVMELFITCDLTIGFTEGLSLSTFEWHIWLGHPNLNKLKLMVPSLDNVYRFRCEFCELSKHSRASLLVSARSRANKLFEVVHSDIWVPYLFPIMLSPSIMYFLLGNIAVCLGFI